MRWHGAPERSVAAPDVSLPFRDRDEAAEALARWLAPLRGSNPLVLAIPRGAVPMARTIADALDGEMDIVLVRKLGAPGRPELAVGAVDERGWTHIEPFAASAGADRDYLEHEIARQRAVIRDRRRRYSPLRPPVDPHGRTVIVVDDGLATGATMIAALHAVRERCPAHLVCAVPVASEQALERVSKLADEVLCLATPDYFPGVGAFYRSFDQVSDESVAAILGRTGDAARPDRARHRD